MTRMLFVAALLPCASALALHAAPCRGPVVASRASAARLGLFDFLKPEAPVPPIEEVPNPAGFTMEELKAVQDASICLEAPARDMKDPPAALVDDTFRKFAISFAAMLRTPELDKPDFTEPAPEAWDAVRAKWPVLAEKTNEELKEALGPIKAQEVDFRQLPQPPWRPPY